MKKKVQLLLGLALGAFLLWFLFRDTDWPSVGAAIRSANPFWFAVATLAILASFFARTQRWSYIVRTAKPVSFKSLFSATQIGFLANFTLPGRAGEIIRALVLTRREQIPFSKSVAFVALDRVTDLVGLLAVMLVVLFAINQGAQPVLPEHLGFSDEMLQFLQPARIRQAALFFLLLLGVVLGGLVFVYLNQRLATRTVELLFSWSPRLSARIQEMLQHFSEGLHIFRNRKDMALSILFSLVTWGVTVFGCYAIIRAFNFDAPWYTAFVVTVTLSLAISIPGAPGFLGQFQLGIIFGLYLCVEDVNIAAAQAAAILTHMLNLLLVVLVGVYCLSTAHLDLAELRRATEKEPAD